MKNSIKKRVKQIFILQGIIAIYSVSSVMAKVASGYSFLSFYFCLFYGFELCTLVIYALLWQQMIKKIDLSIAYANRALLLLWSIVWSIFIFHDAITIYNVIGILFVITGTLVVNADVVE